MGIKSNKVSLYLQLLVLALVASSSASQSSRVRLKNHIPEGKLQSANAISVGNIDPGTPMSLRVAMPLRNSAGLQALLSHIYDPSDPLYHQYLTTEQFNAQFAPSPQDIATVTSYLTNNGFKVSASPSSLLIKAEASAATVQSAFNIEIRNYKTADGRLVHAPTQNPELPSNIAGLVQGVVGLHNASQRKHHMRRPSPNAVRPAFGSDFSGTGMTPADIKTAYNFSATTLTGAGQVMGVLELDGYTAADIKNYATQYGLGTPKLTNVLIDGYSGAAFVNSAEVTLDIEIALAVAPELSIIVYEGTAASATTLAQEDTEWLDIFDRMANDNLAKVISNSWGQTEDPADTTLTSGENTQLMKMASQGQSFFTAAGDSGSYDNGTALTVEDPCSQPYDTCVGGTTLTLGAGGAYSSEKSWLNTPAPGAGGGGGISSVWLISNELNSYQSGLGTVTNKGSTTARMVPDVSFDADPDTGYTIYGTSCGFTCNCTGAVTTGANQNCTAFTPTPAPHAGWYGIGGTSAAAPIWAAFTALVNQQVALNTGTATTVGFMNPDVYAIGKGASYSSNFHDIADGSTNCSQLDANGNPVSPCVDYPAVTGYDLTTGWGSFIGNTFLTTLSTTVGGAVVTPTVPSVPTGLTVEAITQ